MLEILFPPGDLDAYPGSFLRSNPHSGPHDQTALEHPGQAKPVLPHRDLSGVYQGEPGQHPGRAGGITFLPPNANEKITGL